MPLDRYIAGALILAAVIGAAGFAAVQILRRRFPDLTGVERWLALGLLFTTALLAGHLLSGALGILSPGAVLVATGLLALAATRVPAVSAPAERGAAEDPGGAAWLWGPALVAAWVVATYAVAYMATNLTVPTFAYDQTAFRLPTLRDWSQTGTLWNLDLFLVRKNTGTYPQSGDLLILSSMLPFGNDAFVRLVAPPFALMAAAGTYAASRCLEVRRPVAIAASAALVGMPVVAFAAFRGGLPDTIAIGCLAAGLAFLLRADASGRRSHLVLAGLGIGLALGTKWYGLEAAVLLLPLWAIAGRLRGRSTGAVVRDLGVLIGVVALAGGFWLLRNLVVTGNPMYPVRAEVLGISVLDAPVDLERSIYGLSIAEYLDQPSVFADHIFGAWWDQFALAGPLLAAAVLAGPVLALRRLQLERQRALQVLALAAFAVVAFLAYVITPYSGQGFDGMPTFTFVNTRWAVPALIAAAIVTAWLVDRAGRLTIPLSALLALAAIDGALRGVDPARWSLLVFGLVLAAGLWLVMMLRIGRLRPPSRGLAVASAGLLVVAIAAGGYKVQRDFNDGRYLGIDPVLDQLLSDEEERSVGIAGEFGGFEALGPWAAFGPDLDNRVSYVGEEDDGRLLPYSSFEQWREALAGGGYGLVLVSKEEHPVPSDPDEADWAPSTPELALIAESDRFALYQVSPEAGAE